MTQPFISLTGLPARWPFQPVALSLGELCGEAYVRAACANHAVLTGEDPAAVVEAAFKRVEFFPPAFERRLIHLLAGFAHTKFIATHDLDLALDLCERTIVLREGRIAADGPSTEIFADAELLEIPVGSPVLMCRRTTRTVAGEPVLYSEHVFAGHRTEFVVDLPVADRSMAPSGLRLVE